MNFVQYEEEKIQSMVQRINWNIGESKSNNCDSEDANGN